VQFLSAADLRDYMQQTTTTGRWTDAQLGSNIVAAQHYLQRETGRQFEPQQNTAKSFTSIGRAIINIPDLRNADSITKAGSALDSGSYDLLPDRMSSGVYTGLQLRVPDVWRGYGDWYKSDPLWWDKNLDRPNYAAGGSWTSDANDVVITGDWGYEGGIGWGVTPPTVPLPFDALHAIKVLASFYTLRPQSVLAGAQVTPEGALLTYQALPIEVRAFIEQWRLGEQAAAV
jgi:hypothetical protein